LKNSSILGLEMILMGGTTPEVWIATSNGRDMIRADAIVVVRMDCEGRVTAQLRDEARVTVTLVEGSAEAGTPDDFHRQFVRAVAELADSSGAQLVRPLHDERGWRWTAEPL
jgi:hypothetical protein